MSILLISRSDRSNLIKGAVFLSPWIVGFIAFTALPVGLCLYYSFCDYSLLKPPMFRGLENYQTLFGDRDVFWNTLLVTGYYAALALPLGLILSLILALLLNVKTPGQTLYRTIIFLPSLVPAVASAMLWLWLLNPKLGMVNLMLHKMGISYSPGWYADKFWAMPSLVLMSLWGLGNTVIIYLAGLQDVPRELYEAAELDGANTLGKVLNVTLPCISPVIFFNLIMAIIGTLQIFTNAMIITQGGPERATEFYTMEVYSKAFVSLKMGEASAMAWIQLLIILALTAVAFWTSKHWVHYQGR
jgi:multiple sugar transport system permease protein